MSHTTGAHSTNPLARVAVAAPGFGADALPSPPTTVAVIESLATGAPARIVDQTTAAGQVAALFDDPAVAERIVRVYDKTRIATRHLAIDPMAPEFLEYSRRPGTVRERMNMYFEHATPLAVDVAGRAIAGIADPAAEIGMLIFVTSTGFIAPGVDVAVIKQLGLSQTISRVVVNFMGCAAAVNGLRTATDYVRAHPDSKALVVCLELSSVNAVFGEDPVEVVTHSLFGDGCGAMVVGASEVGRQLPAGRIVVRDTFSHLFDDAEDGIVLGVNDDGITCDLSQQLPDYIYRGVGPALDAAIARSGLGRDDIDLWAIHPGGPAILHQSARSLGLSEERSQPSWDVLRDYGNMLSVSLVFVLERMLADEAARDHAEPVPPSTGVAFSFAPGVTLEGILFDVVRG
ncbi:alpha-pyrone synthesis polyketide synthase-like Pks18 [Gordonia spumicola]|uniref:Alpha-pyrone synthesis polyketide synthase-like Pks18 n=1 Tax=Gordonia spumicola TaxID=589161 RepID=A0A7I9VBV7_9ACTN|nr:3-oxoacyl-[acyl-carrier-protein] synthase III C-terminal domain-containing protein [Gordonia spumicola]GEE02856.1 alpha-pyrone synthesis polyketide synthase-like Pks18 [Gordonia spumicola]